MANWANPLITTQYDVFLAECKERDVDAATMFLNVPTTPPVGSVRFNRVTKVFEEWSGSAWVVLILGLTGGGTGGTGPALGSMAYQNSNAVNISGGTGTFGWLIVQTVIVPPTNLGADLGDNARRFNKGYISGGLVIPVGVDKYVVG